MSKFYACKGAEASHVGNQISALQMDNPAKAGLGWSNSVFTVTLGGNDLRTKRGDDWPKLLERCILEVNPFGGCHDVTNNQINNWGTVQSSVQATLTQLANAAPNAKIRVMGYPNLMGPTKNWLGIWNCADVTGVTGNEARWIDQQAATLNTVITNAVNAVKAAKPSVNIQFVSVTGQ
ncbi:MAG TPA: hypothetical protein PLV68_16510, partial [Ilumatobacteraceae bacterium]|nr:hypothetical protein [Ilumatobacteraceae bacterium]